MNIMLLADNKKTDLLANFVLAYRQILGKYNLISTFNISKQIKEHPVLMFTLLLLK